MLFTIAFVMLMLFLTPVVIAEEYDEYDYYIMDFRTDVIFSNDRSHYVTEVITVHFNVESTGFSRDIQMIDSGKRYRVENIDVVGNPFTVAISGDYISIQIGDPDTSLIGEKTFTISYTRHHYDDGETSNGFFRLDLINNHWDAPIAHFYASVRFPDDAEISNFTITSGLAGSTGSDYAEGFSFGSMIDVRMKKPLDPSMKVTLNVDMPQDGVHGDVSFAKSLEIHSINVSAELDDFGVMTLTEIYDATVNKPIRVWHPASFSNGVYALSWIEPVGEVDGFISFSPYFLDNYVGQRIRFSFIYQINFPITEQDSDFRFNIQMFGNSDDISVDKYSVNVTSPFEITQVDFLVNDSYLSSDAYESSLENNRRHLHFEADANPDMHNVSVVFSSSGFIRASKSGDFIVPIIAAVVAAIIFLFAFVIRPEKKLVFPVEFYPPDDMNPAEMGFILSGKTSGRAITSLISYWASHGHLSIEIIDNSGNFILHKKNELDSTHRYYEKEMYEKLFSLGTDGSVSKNDLKHIFSFTVTKTSKMIRRYYTGKRLLNRVMFLSEILSFAMIAGCFALFYAFSELWVYTSNEALTSGIIAALLYLMICVLLLQHQKLKYNSPALCRTFLVLSIVLFGAFASLVVITAAGKSLTITSTVITLASLAVAFYSIPFLRRKTDLCVFLLGRIVGFKKSIVSAEKSRLKRFLEQNPDYCFNILPYAQILGVSRVWESKFGGLLSKPPTWCYSDSANTTSVIRAVQAFAGKEQLLH